MLPLYRDPHFVFRFADDRIVPRFHLEGVGAGQLVAVYSLDPTGDVRAGPIARAIVGDGGWVDLQEALIVRAGGGFVVAVEPPTPDAGR
jgi:hypothetical protein